MPELPEVETVVRGLARCIVGRRIADVIVLHAPSIQGSPEHPRNIKGKRVIAVTRQGKFIRIALEDGWGLAIHLRMTGWLGVQPCSARNPKREPYDRLKFILDAGQDWLLFNDIRTFGRVWCGTVEELNALRALSKLGPDPLAISAADFGARLRNRGGCLKALLLNQEFLAGVGNIYADEALHAAQLHPLAKASGVSPERARALHKAIQKVLKASIKSGGTSIENFLNTDGEAGWFQRRLLVYGRAGEPCQRCGALIKRIVMGQRGTWFCPKCQKRR